MNPIVQTLMAVDTYTWVCMAGMAAFGASCVSSLAGSWLMALLYFPGLMVGELALRSALMSQNFVFVPDKSVNTLIVVGMGAMLALVVLIVLTRVVMGISAALTPAPRRDNSEMPILARRRI